MKLIIGLGNPGDKYQKNRHNAGHMFVEFAGKGIKTDVFMNSSGRFVSEKLNFYKITLDDLYIAHDDLDIPLGQFKIQKEVGPKVHNGINGIEEILGTKDFWRIRIGVDNRAHSAEAPRAKGEDYVLQNFKPEELDILHKVFDEIIRDHSFPD